MPKRLQMLGEFSSSDATVLYTPQDLTADQKAQARENIGVADRLEIEVFMKDVGAELVGASVGSVFAAVNAGNTVVLHRDTESGERIYYRLDERKQSSDGSETLTFAHKSAALEQYVHLTMGGPLDGGQGNIGVGTKATTAKTVGAVPAPLTAEIGQAMCVTKVDENNKPVSWGMADLPTDSEWRLARSLTITEDGVTGIDVTEDDDGNPLNFKECCIEWHNSNPPESSEAYIRISDEDRTEQVHLRLIGWPEKVLYSLWFVRRLGGKVYFEVVQADQPDSDDNVIGKPYLYDFNNIKEIILATDGRQAIANGATFKLYVKE